VREELAPELEIVRRLGSGQAARVYLAREPGLGRSVAVKVLRSQAAEVRARFERESRTAAALTHENVVGIYRSGRLANGSPYLVMQYVRGQSLAERLRSDGEASVAEVRRMVRDVASGLSAAHARGVVHRDIRPANLLWDADAERVLIADFGLAGLLENWRGDVQHLTQVGEVLGDPRYVSPEQLRGEPVTGASDIYSLALVAAEMSSGRVPHESSSRLAVITARLQDAPVQLPAALVRADPALANLLQRCLSLEPQNWPDAAAVARVGSGHGTVEPSPLLVAGAQPLLDALARRRMPQWIGGAAATGWILLEVVNQLEQQDVLPAVFYPLTLVSVMALVIGTAIVAWYHGERGAQVVPRGERMLLGAVLVAWVAGVIAVVMG